MKGRGDAYRMRLAAPPTRGSARHPVGGVWRLSSSFAASWMMAWTMAWLMAWNPASLVRAGEAEAAPNSRPANVLLITLDTTRFDHLGCYGYGRPTSPEIDRLADRSLRFERAYSTSSWTLPAHASLLTGRAVSGHGARYDEEGPLLLSAAFSGPAGLAAYRVRGLDPGVPSFASVLHARGYRTGAVVAGPWLKALFGLARGFDSYDDSGIEELNGRSGEAVTAAALLWLAEERAAARADESAPVRGARPFFLFLNYFDAHYPYQPPPDLRDRFLRDYGQAEPNASERAALITHTIALYDAEIRAADRAIGRLLDEAERRGWLDHTWIVVTADHGELLGEHGLWAHGKSLSEPEIRVPLLLRPPRGLEPQIDTRAVLSLVDVMPTLLAQLGIEAPPGMQGRAIGSGAAASAVLAEFYPLPVLKRGRGWRAWIEGGWKLVEELGEANRLYDLQSDPAEQRDRFADLPSRAAALRAQLDAYLVGVAGPRPDATQAEHWVDGATRRALKALGYLEAEHPDEPGREAVKPQTGPPK